MNEAATLPDWAAITIALCVLGGALFTLIGTIGLVRFRTMYQRVHAPTLGSSFGVAGIALGSIVYFTVTRETLALAAALIFLFVTMTMPVGLVLLVRAALFRDRSEQNEDVPAAGP